MGLFKEFKNVLALVVLLTILVLWALQGLAVLALPGQVEGATISIGTLIVQYYFRKSTPVSEVP